MTRYAGGALSLAIEGAVATLTLDQPDRRNAINDAMWRALPTLLDDAADTDAAVLIVQGAGGHFAAGADIGEFPTVFADRSAAHDYATLMGRALSALAGFERPTIASIAGSCIGAGLAIALACDLRLASETARFGVTPAKLGLLYPLADTKRLVDVVGPSAAKDLLFTGRIVPAADALAMRLIDELHPSTALDAAVAAKAALIAHVSPWSVRQAKRVIDRVLKGVTTDTEETRGWFADAVEGADFREGLAAFQAKRTPRFGAGS